MGVRKDYWNFISESVPKDESVRFVQATPEVSYFIYLFIY